MVRFHIIFFTLFQITVINVLAQSLQDSTVYFYYIDQPSVDSVYYHLHFYKNGAIKEEGWKIKIDDDHDLEEIPNDLIPGEDYTDIKVGEYRQYFRNGNIQLKRITHLNRSDSIHVQKYNKKGTLDTEIWFPHKKLCKCNHSDTTDYGSYRKIYKNKSIKSEGARNIFTFRKVGWWLYYDENRNIKYKKLYKDGKVIEKE